MHLWELEDSFIQTLGALCPRHLLGAWESLGKVNKSPPTNISALKEFPFKRKRQTNVHHAPEKAEK